MNTSLRQLFVLSQFISAAFKNYKIKTQHNNTHYFSTLLFIVSVITAIQESVQYHYYLYYYVFTFISQKHYLQITNISIHIVNIKECYRYIYIYHKILISKLRYVNIFGYDNIVLLLYYNKRCELINLVTLKAI